MCPKVDRLRYVWLFVAVTVGLVVSSCDLINPRAEPGPEGARWIEKAIDLYAGPKEEDRRRALSHSEPIVVFLPESVCVAFKLRKSTIGGETTVCFARSDETLQFIHTEGQ